MKLLSRLFGRNGTVLSVPPTPLDERGVTEARSVTTLLSLSGRKWEYDPAEVQRVEHEVQAHLYAQDMRPRGGE